MIFPDTPGVRTRLTVWLVADPAVLAHGVIAPDQRSAVFADVQLDESVPDRGVTLRLPGLDPHTGYACERLLPAEPGRLPGWVTGADLARVGIRLPRQRPETIRLIALRAVPTAEAK